LTRDRSGVPYRIVQLTSSGNIGGTERMVIELAARLDREKFEPIVLSLVGSGDLADACRQRGIEAEHLDCRHPLSWRAWQRFCQIVWERNVTLVHLYGLRANLPGRRLARWAGARAVVCGIRSTDPWRKWRHAFLDRLTARWADCFISNSEAGRQATIRRERFDPARVVTIHNGIGEMPSANSFDRAALQKQFRLEPTAQPVAAVVANLGPEKRHRDLIDAARLLAERCPSIVFLCAGRDEMGGANQRYASERGVAERFRWLGHVSEVHEVIAAADFAILPSSHEGLPVSIVEAMAMGRTVIATDVGGVPEIVTNGVNGLLVQPRRPDALASAIERLATDAVLRQRLERAALETVRRDFPIERMIERTEQIYLGLIERRSS